MPLLDGDDDVRTVLLQAKTLAVVGLSNKPWRDSYTVTQYMLQQGYRVIPVNPVIPSVFNIRAVPSLRDIDVHVDIVNVFRRARFVADIVTDAIAIRAGTVWLQSGIIDEPSAQRASDAGMNVIMDRCIRVAHTLLVR